MNVISYFAVLLTCIVTSVIAQTPQNIEPTLKIKYPNATIRNVKHDQFNYVATFTNDGKKCKALFDGNRKWLQTETAMKWKTLPVPVRKGFVKSCYSSWLIEDVNQIETPTNTIYSVEVDNEYTLGGDRQPAFSKTCYVYFTPAGDFVKEVDVKGFYGL